MKRLLLGTLLSIAAIFGASAEVLTVSQCTELARQHYPAIAQYGLLDKIEQFNLSNAAKVWLPQGAVSAQLTWQNDVSSLPDALTGIMTSQGISYPGLDKTQYRVGVDINQQIWDGGTTAANRQAIKTASQVERRSLDLQLYDVEGRVEEIYFAIMLLDGRLERTDQSIALVDSTLSQLQSMFNNGVAMKSDCDQVEARLLQLEQQKIQLASTRNSYARVLEIFIGEEIGARELQFPNASSDAEANHPQLQLFDSRINNIAAQEAAIKASVMPRLEAFVSGYYGYPGYNLFKNMQSHDPSFNFMVGIKASWNFSSLYTRKNSLNKLALQRQQVEADRNTFLFNNSIASSESRGQIDYLRNVMQNDERIVELRNSVMRAAQSQLRNGVIDATALLTKITDVDLAENDLALHRIELMKTIYQLNHIRNK